MIISYQNFQPWKFGHRFPSLSPCIFSTTFTYIHKLFVIRSLLRKVSFVPNLHYWTVWPLTSVWDYFSSSSPVSKDLFSNQIAIDEVNICCCFANWDVIEPSLKLYLEVILFFMCYTVCPDENNISTFYQIVDAHIWRRALVTCRKCHNAFPLSLLCGFVGAGRAHNP